MSDPFADKIDDTDWDEACGKADVIRKFLRRESGPTTVGQRRELAGPQMLQILRRHMIGDNMTRFSDAAEKLIAQASGHRHALQRQLI
jgi:hypothetical protein